MRVTCKCIFLLIGVVAIVSAPRVRAQDLLVAEAYYSGTSQLRYRYTYYLDEFAQEVKHGLETRWAASGQTQQEIPYEHGLRHGTYRAWADNGVMTQEGPYVQGEQHGLWRYWSWSDDWLDYETTYEHDVATTRIEYKYYSGGALKYVTHQAKSGASFADHGPYFYYHEGGGLLQAGFFEWNQKHGLWSTYDSATGMLKERGSYEHDLAEGVWTYWAATTHYGGPYRGGKRHGTWSSYITADDALYWQQDYRDGLRHGWLFEWYYPSGSLKSMTEYRDDVRHGYHEYYHFTAPYLLNGVGQFADDNHCGVWNFWRSNGSFHQSLDYGPCGSLPIDDPPYPEVNTNDTQQKEIRGRVVASGTGETISGAVVSGGGYTATSGADGFYSMEIGTEDVLTLNCARTGYSPYAETVGLTGVQYKAVHFSLVPDAPAGNTTPVISGVKSKYGFIFLAGVLAPNTYTVSVNWNGGTPKSVIFDLNGTEHVVAATAQGASVTFVTGLQFTSSTDPRGNTLSIVAEDQAGLRSDPVKLHPILMPVPEWVALLGAETKYTATAYDLIYTFTFAFPQPPVQLQVNSQSLGPTLWPLWTSLPFNLGRPFGITNTQAYTEIELKSNGSLAGALGGRTGFEVAGAAIAGKIFGKLEGKYAPNDGVVLEKGTMGIEVERGQFTAETTLLTLVPQLAPLRGKRFVGPVIDYIESKGKIRGYVYAGAGLQMNIYDSSKGGFGLHKISGEPNGGLGAEMKVKVNSRVEATARGKAGVRVVLQAPANPGYIERAQVEGEIGVEIVVYGFALSETVAVAYPGEAPGVPGERRPAGGALLRPLPRVFLALGPYHEFVAPPVAALGEEPMVSADTVAHVPVLANVFPHADPVLAATTGAVGIVYVYSDPADPVLQANEIHFIYKDASGYRVPAAVTNDTRSEFAPVLAFDVNGRAVAAWERVKDPAFAATNGLDQLVDELEIVYASYDPATSTWSAPVALTDNAVLDFLPQLAAGPGGNILLTWVRNPDGDILGTASAPSRVWYSEWDAGARAFTAPADMGHDVVHGLEFDVAWDGTNGVLTYASDTDGVLFDTNGVDATLDQEIFYHTFDGATWSAATRLTDDALPDGHPRVACLPDGSAELLWVRDGSMVMLTNWVTGAHRAIRDDSSGIGFLDSRMVVDSQGRIVFYWQDHRDEQTDLYYAVYDAGHDSWSADLQLTDSSNLEYAVTGDFAPDGILHLAALEEDGGTGEADLIHLAYSLGIDAAVSAGALSVAETNPVPGQQVALSCRVHNAGDLALEDVPVAFYHGDSASGGVFIASATVVPSLLAAGTGGLASATWNLPAGGTNFTVHAVVDPSNVVVEVSESNNVVSLDLVHPDLEALGCRAEPYGSGEVDLIAEIRNGGGLHAGRLTVQFLVDSNAVAEVEIPGLLTGRVAEVMTTVWGDTEFQRDRPRIDIRVDPGDLIAEEDESNNMATTYLAYLVDLDGDGMDDHWENESFGTLGRFGWENFDNDGLTDGEEFIAGTSATNAGDFLALEARHVSEAGEAVLAWPGVDSRRYGLWASTNLLSGWSKLYQVLGRGTEITITNRLWNTPQEFYRLKVEYP